jgi:hypothetical protein
MAEDILHFGGMRYRVTGSGNLRTTMKSLDDVKSITLATIAMSTAPGQEPFRLTNLISQRARYRVETTEMDEVFTINRIVVFVKPIYSGYPQ